MDVSVCNFHHHHTFVFVHAVKCCSPLTPTSLLYNNCLASVWKEEKKNLFHFGVREQTTYPPTFLSFYLGHIHSSGWLSFLSVKAITQMCVQEFLSVPPPLLTAD
ncbi:hypothetical protein XENOCAPTIV_019390 [Xenoophorus captivus]|uniref:Uncharacterized protein n=1 Tax=Xenoophorus captivus TaxID=1517983 RepID=A0ABV0R442_9TELE